MLVGALEVRAATITIDKAETQTNGGQTLTEGGGDTITVTETGSITTEGSTFFARRPAISALTDSNTISNEGKLNTKGENADGIRAGSNNTITNEAGGSISTEGDDAKGIWAYSNNTITNSGSITTINDISYGIIACGDNNKIINTGRIQVSGSDVLISALIRQAGIFAVNGNELTLSGYITSAQASALILYDSNTINHCGTLRSTPQVVIPRPSGLTITTL